MIYINDNFMIYFMWEIILLAIDTNAIKDLFNQSFEMLREMWIDIDMYLYDM